MVDSGSRKQPTIELSKLIVPLWIFLPGIAVVGSLIIHEAKWVDIGRYFLLTVSTTVLSYCVGSCSIKFLRLRELLALREWIDESDYPIRTDEILQRCNDFAAKEERAKRVQLATTGITLISWFMVVQNHCEQITGDNGNMCLAGFAFTTCVCLIIWKIHENQMSTPIGIFFAGAHKSHAKDQGTPFPKGNEKTLEPLDTPRFPNGIPDTNKTHAD